MNLDMPDDTRHFINDWDRRIMQDHPYRYAGLWESNRRAMPLDNVIAWCRENFGEDQFTWKGMTFFFKREQDMVLFALRWS